MIELQLVDGRVLQFIEGAQQRQVGAGPLFERDIAAVATGEFSVSERLRRGPDFLLSEPRNPDRRVAVEVKSGLSRANPEAFVQQLARYTDQLAGQFGRVVPLQLWTLSTDGSSIDVSDYNADRRLGETLTYYLANVATSTVGELLSNDQVVAGSNQLGTGHIERRLDDWEQRVLSLYDTVEIWSQRIAGIDTDRHLTVSVNEEMMRRYAVPPRSLPVLRLTQDKEAILTFKPYGLWIIGANGRIDIVAPKASYFLLDTAEKFSAPIWKLYGSGDRRIEDKRLALGIDFTAEALGALLRG